MTSLTWLYLPTAFVLGLAHALEPGHSKTIMASYLISIRGTSSDALLLGLTVTFTHTIVVFLLALGVVLLGQAFPLDSVQHWLEIVSAALVFLMGLWLLISRIRALRGSKGHDSGHSHAPNHHQSPLHPPDHSHGHAHEHGHDHDHGHVHSLATPGQRLSLRQLIAFGLSGGLVPCPAGVAMLILAVGMGKPVLGLVCVVVFSLGLAAALVGVGVAVCRGLGLFESKLARWMKHLPIVSALIVALLGLWMLLRALFGHHHDTEALPARGA